MKKHIYICSLICSSSALLLVFSNSKAQTKWTYDGVAVSGLSTSETIPHAVGDGSGGVIIVWQDNRNNSNDIYAQRLDINGTQVWANSGVPICTASGSQEAPQVTTDQNGGAIFVWRDRRVDSDGDIYIQRVGADGTAIWQTNGIPICTTIHYQGEPRIISDGFGGAIIVWQDRRNADSGNGSDLYAQRVDGSGNALWAADGVSVISVPGDQDLPVLVGDGDGGVYVAWRHKDFALDNSDVYAQHLNSSGEKLWEDFGKIVASGSAFQEDVDIALLSDGKCVLVWRDGTDPNVDIIAEVLDKDGNRYWSNKVIRDGLGENPKVATDSLGFIYITYEDYKTSNDGIYAQKLRMDGQEEWTVAVTQLQVLVRLKNLES